MTRRARANAAAASGGTQPGWDMQRLVAIALLGVLAARPLIPETWYADTMSFISGAAGGGPTPLATLWLDALLLLLATLGFALAPRRPSPLIAAGVALLSLAIAVSTFVASDKRLALNAGFDLLAIVIAGCALVQLARPRGLAPLIVAAVIASGGVNAVKCVLQSSYEFADTYEVWLERKAELAASEVDLSSQTIEDYERRLRSAEAFGLLSHPNVTAACMVAALALAVAWLLGLLWARPSDVEQWLAVLIAGGGCALLGVAIVLTGSFAGLATAGGAIGLLLLYAVSRPWIRANWRRYAWLLVGGYCLLIAGGAAYGTLRGTLPSDSLRFRWQYWTATAQVIADAPWTGVGRENFAAPYLRYKPAEATEEIRNAHDVWLALLAELGVLGLAAGVILGGAVVFGAISALQNRGAAEARTPRSPLFDIAVLAIIALATQAWFSGTPFGVLGIGLLWTGEVALVFVGALVLTLGAATRLPRFGEGGDILVAGCAAALLAALTHNLIGFSLFTPAGLATFVLVGCAAFSARPAEDCGGAPHQRGSALRRLPAAFCSFVLLTQLGLAAIPATRAGRFFDELRSRLATARTLGDVLAAMDSTDAALAADRWNAEIPQWLARALLPLALRTDVPVKRRLDILSRAEALLAVAAKRDPAANSTLRTAARVFDERARLLDGSGDARGALAALRRADAAMSELISRYPTQPRDRIMAARIAIEVWHAAGEDDAAGRACEHLTQAQAIDATRPAEATARLNEAELQEIADLRASLRAGGMKCE